MTRMASPQVTVWGSEAWGLSWAIDDVDGVRQISHGGGTKGQITLLALIPERDFAIAVLTNSNWGSFVTREVSHWALKEYLGERSKTCVFTNFTIPTPKWAVRMTSP